MKTIEELKRLREKLQHQHKIEQNVADVQVILGMGTCGIAAGAREVMTALLEEIAKRNLTNVVIKQTGCIGMCEKEVLLDVVRPGEPRITYGKVKPSHVAQIVAEHIVNGRIIEELVVGKIEN